MNFMVVTAMALWFDAILNVAHVICMNTIKHGLMLQIDSLHKKGAHNQCNSTAKYSAI